MTSTKELSLKIEDLEERIAPHLVIYPDVHASDNATPTAHPEADVHGRLGSPSGLADAGEVWRLSTPGTDL